jgi:hypothetical protein
MLKTTKNPITPSAMRTPPIQYQAALGRTLARSGGIAGAEVGAGGAIG